MCRVVAGCFTLQYNTVQMKFITRARSHRNVNLRRGLFTLFCVCMGFVYDSKIVVSLLLRSYRWTVSAQRDQTTGHWNGTVVPVRAKCSRVPDSCSHTRWPIRRYVQGISSVVIPFRHYLLVSCSDGVRDM